MSAPHRSSRPVRRLAAALVAAFALQGALAAPDEGKAASAPMLAGSASPAASGPSKKPALIDINTASEADLRTLPGITAARAQAIVVGRPYAKPDELVGQRILPDAVYGKIKVQLTASKPLASPGAGSLSPRP